MPRSSNMAESQTFAMKQDSVCWLLNGCGVRALSSLYILKSIMGRLDHERKQTASHPLAKACGVFDLFIGSNAGG